MTDDVNEAETAEAPEPQEDEQAEAKPEAEAELYPVNDPAPREPWSPLEAVARSDR